jgi:hypothetical protein
MNEITNVSNTVAEELVDQLKDGTAELVEVKSGTKGKLITGGIALGATAGAGILGWFLGRRHERKKWESFDEDEDEDFDDFEDDDEDYVEYVETEPTDTAKEAEKTDKPEEK